MTQIIGITGGIGSGKSTVCRLFQAQGIAVYEADSQAKAVIEKNRAVMRAIQAVFGENAYFSDGRYNRKYIADIVFQEPEKLAQLNAIVHPAVKQDFEDWFSSQKENNSPRFILKEAAILYEAGTYKDTDAVITVYAPKNIRLQRVMQRDNISEKEALSRMQRQWADAKKIQKADFVIFNDGKHDLMAQVQAFFIRFLDNYKK